MKSLVRSLTVMSYCMVRPITWMGMLARARRRVARWALDGAETDQRLAQEHTAASRWCAERAVKPMELRECLPFDFRAESLGTLFPHELKLAKDLHAECPVTFGGAGHLDLLYSLARAIDARRVVETGVGFGWSSLALLLAINENGDDASLWSVDFPYLSEWDSRWTGAAVPRNMTSQWYLIRAADRQGLPLALRQCTPLDFAHYDSDKSASGRLFAYGQIWQALRTGGVLVSDDIGDNFAFKSFAEHVGRKPTVVGRDSKYQGILIK